MSTFRLLLVALLLLPIALPAAAVSFGQLDDFQDGTTQGWIHGGLSPVPPTNEGGGRGGPDDRFLRNRSLGSGSGNPGSRHTVFNPAQWAGDYTAAGVASISMWLANFGPTELAIRLNLEGAGGTFATETAAVLPAPGAAPVWTQVVFPVGPDDLTGDFLGGGSDVLETLADVSALRLVHTPEPATRLGIPQIEGVLGIDDILAIPEPTTGLLAALGLGALGAARRR
ncbi:MAG: PEP-CTERM sorting domain-containing protein [Myxococcota bacterium]|nr:PEP-CTERM sorting domain-containing protein [Myxococcota bacterium]